MDCSISFAKLLGLYALTFGVLGFLVMDHMKRTITEIFANSAVLALSGCLSMLLGFAILIWSGPWGWNWVGLVNLIGLVAVIKGIVRIAFPAKAKKLAHTAVTRYYGLAFGITLLIGVYLTYVSFFQ